MKYYLILGFGLLISVFSGCCIQLIKRQTLNQQLGTFVAMNAAYDGPQTMIILFSDGSLVSSSVLGFDDAMNKIQDRKRFDIYNGSPFDWGKYYIAADTIHIEHIVGEAPGGGFCRFMSLRYSGLIKEDHLKIFPGPEEIYKGYVPVIYPKNGIVYKYKGTVTDDVIDPSKAKFNR